MLSAVQNAVVTTQINIAWSRLCDKAACLVKKKLTTIDWDLYPGQPPISTAHATKRNLNTTRKVCWQIPSPTQYCNDSGVQYSLSPPKQPLSVLDYIYVLPQAQGILGILLWDQKPLFTMRERRMPSSPFLPERSDSDNKGSEIWRYLLDLLEHYF